MRSRAGGVGGGGVSGHQRRQASKLGMAAQRRTRPPPPLAMEEVGEERLVAVGGAAMRGAGVDGAGPEYEVAPGDGDSSREGR